MRLSRSVWKRQTLHHSPRSHVVSNISAHICDCSVTYDKYAHSRTFFKIATLHQSPRSRSLTSTKSPRFRSIESVRQNVGFALYRPNETVYIRQANKTVCRYCLQADYGFDSLDRIPTLPKCRKRKAKRRVRSIPTKRNGVYSTSE